MTHYSDHGFNMDILDACKKSLNNLLDNSSKEYAQLSKQENVYLNIEAAFSQKQIVEQKLESLKKLLSQVNDELKRIVA